METMCSVLKQHILGYAPCKQLYKTVMPNALYYKSNERTP